MIGGGSRVSLFSDILFDTLFSRTLGEIPIYGCGMLFKYGFSMISSSDGLCNVGCARFAVQFRYATR